MNLEPQLEGDRLFEAVRNAIEAKPEWVLVLDNADDLALFGAGQAGEGGKSLADFIPKGSAGPGTVLWTSRDGRIVGSLVGSRRGIQVSRMTANEARHLLSIARDEPAIKEDTDVNILLEELGCLPLALWQSGAYMRTTSTSIKEYLSLLTHGKHRWDVLNQTRPDRHRKPDAPNSVLEAWRISTQRVREESVVAYRILHVLAYMDGKAVPHEILVAASGNAEQDQTGQEQDFPEITQAIARLRDYSFAEMHLTDDGRRNYEIHALIQEALRYGLHTSFSLDSEEPRQPSDDQTSARNLEGEVFFSGTAVQVVNRLFPLSLASSSKPETWPECERYLTHAIRMEAWAEICGQPVELSVLLGRVSRYLRDRGRWREIESVNQKAFEVTRLAFGEEHPETLDALARIGNHCTALTQYQKSEEIMDKVLATQRGVLGEKDMRTISTMLSFAHIYYARGKFDQSNIMGLKALALRREALGDRHPDTLAAMRTLGGSYVYQRRYAEGEKVLTKAMDLQREVLGWKHPQVLESSMYLGQIFHETRRFDEAEKIFREVLDLRREILGDKHPYTLANMTCLAGTYRCKGRLRDAEKLLVGALGSQKEVHGERYPDTLDTIEELAWIWKAQGRRLEALSLMKECLEGRIAVLGLHHVETEATRKYIAEMDRSDGRLTRFIDRTVQALHR